MKAVWIRLLRRIMLRKRLKAGWRGVRNPESGEPTDELTGALKPDFLLNPFNRTLALAIRGQLFLSIVLMDVDNLGIINEESYDRGNKLLKDFGKNIKGQIRSYDIFGRVFYAGDEFILLLPNTDSSAAEEFIGRLYKGFPQFCWGISELKKEDTSGLPDPVIVKKEDILKFPLVKRAEQAMKEMKKRKK